MENICSDLVDQTYNRSTFSSQNSQSLQHAQAAGLSKSRHKTYQLIFKNFIQ